MANIKGSSFAMLVCLGLAWTLISCGPSEESTSGEDNQVTDTSPSVPMNKGSKQKTPQRFTVQADTLHATSRKRDSSAASIEIRKRIPKKYYSVQIGAFRSEYNIKHNQELLDKRFHRPVITFFDRGISLTRICVGQFPSEEAALKFLRSMQEQFPNDYKQAWVASLK